MAPSLGKTLMKITNPKRNYDSLGGVEGVDTLGMRRQRDTSPKPAKK